MYTGSISLNESRLKSRTLKRVLFELVGAALTQQQHHPSSHTPFTKFPPSMFLGQQLTLKTRSILVDWLSSCCDGLTRMDLAYTSCRYLIRYQSKKILTTTVAPCVVMSENIVMATIKSGGTKRQLSTDAMHNSERAKRIDDDDVDDTRSNNVMADRTKNVDTKESRHHETSMNPSHLLPNSLKWTRMGDGQIHVTVRTEPLLPTTTTTTTLTLVQSQSKLKFQSQQDGNNLTTVAIRTTDNNNSTDNDNTNSNTASNNVVPDSVLQYERQLRKVEANRKSITPVNRKDHLRIVYEDEYLIVTNKPSGILCVPGLHNKPNLLQLVSQHLTTGTRTNGNVDQLVYGGAVDNGDRTTDAGMDTPNDQHCHIDNESDIPNKNETGDSTATATADSRLIVHRLDMDTSGVVIFAKTDGSLKKLQSKFRDRATDVVKEYHALVCGHIPFRLGHIHLPLQRDHQHPPFMRVATPRSEYDAQRAVQELQTHGFRKLVKKNPKLCHTEVRVLGYEYCTVRPPTVTPITDDTNVGEVPESKESLFTSSDEQRQLPVTRVLLIPHTGRTHQLRVHMAAIGYPILGDPAYGLYGEANPGGGCTTDDEDVASEGGDNKVIVDDAVHVDGRSGVVMKPLLGASLELQRDLLQAWPTTTKQMCLHAAKLCMDHPITNEPMTWQAPTPF